MSPRPLRYLARLLVLVVPANCLYLWVRWDNILPMLPGRIVERGVVIYWLSRSDFALMFSGAFIVIAIVACLATHITPEGWRPDAVSWFAMLGFYALAAIVVKLESLFVNLHADEIPRKHPLQLPDPAIICIFFSVLAVALGWKFWNWAQRPQDEPY